MGRTWIRIHTKEWLEDEVRQDSPDIRSVWIDLLVLAGRGYYGWSSGEIKLNGGVGLRNDQIAEILHIKKSLWLRAKAHFLLKGRITIDTKGAIALRDWCKYQSEYDRQKPYRVAKPTNPTPETNSPLASPLKSQESRVNS